MKPILIIAGLCAASCLASCSSYNLPGADDVRGIHAELRSPKDESVLIKRFKVPVEDHPEFIELFEQSDRSIYRLMWRKLGSVEISTDTSICRFNIFYTGEKAGAFETNGKYYRGGSDREFMSAINASRKRTRRR